METQNKNNNTIKTFFKGTSNILKLALWLFGIQLIISLFSIVLLVDAENPNDLIKLLSIVMLASNILIMFFISKSSAYTDFQIYKNNLIREKNNDKVPTYNKMKGYKFYNGFIAGLIAVLPSIIMVIIGLIQNPMLADTNAIGKIAMVINFVYTVPILNLGGANSLYFVFAGCFITILSAGIGYYIQGEKLKIQYEQLQKGTK